MSRVVVVVVLFRRQKWQRKRKTPQNNRKQKQQFQIESNESILLNNSSACHSPNPKIFGSRLAPINQYNHHHNTTKSIDLFLNPSNIQPASNYSTNPKILSFIYIYFYIQNEYIARETAILESERDRDKQNTTWQVEMLSLEVERQIVSVLHVMISNKLCPNPWKNYKPWLKSRLPRKK